MTSPVGGALTWPDYVVLGAVLVVLLLIGGAFSWEQRGTRDFFLARRRIPWWAACLSILALYGVHRWHLLYVYLRHRRVRPHVPAAQHADPPHLTVQLPLFNELHVAERLIAIGRRPAPERIAHLLLELLTRLQTVGLADERSFRLPLTQEVISDVLGLSIPYVNRVLQQLRAAGLVRISGHQVVVENIEELSAVADFEQTYLKPLPIAELLADQA